MAALRRVNTNVIFLILLLPAVLGKLAIVLLSQQNKFHHERALVFRTHIDKQINSENSAPLEVEVYFMHETYPNKGAWTLLPLFTQWGEQFSGHDWVMICEEETRVDIQRLLNLLTQYDSTKLHFLGHALQDKEHVIIHHFFFDSEQSFDYPDFAAGVLFSQGLIQKLAEYSIKPDFSIDAKHELAMFVSSGESGVYLTNLPELCTKASGEECITTLPVHFPDCKDPVSNDDLFVAVKTCQTYHNDRVVVVKNTWARETNHITFYSDHVDPSIPTVDLGIPNTKLGHCGKTMAILKQFNTDLNSTKYSWLLIADDDTIISITRLRELLSCYDESDAVALGERYGYSSIKSFGYDYITGGGGMVFSRATAKALAASCQCPGIDSPDDMILGICLQRANIPITHSYLFHQTHPNDYSADYLSHQRPVSFHKHLNGDPYEVYKDWFASDAVFHDEL